MTRTTVNVLRALGDPVRWDMMTRIAAAGELNGAALDVELSKSTVSHHLRILADAGVITTRRSGRSQVHRLNEPALLAAARSLQNLTTDGAGDADPPPPGDGPAASRYNHVVGDDTPPTW